MASINKVILLGRLGADPVRRTTRDGKEFSTFSIATSKKVKEEERTVWHNVVVWNEHTAKYTNDFACKGTLAYVEGEIEQRSYEKEGQKHYAIDIVVGAFSGTVQVLADGVGRGVNADRETGTQKETRRIRDKRTDEEPHYTWEQVLDDEIPF